MEISTESLLRKVPSAYKLVILASRRAFDINEGSPKLISTKLEKASLIALEEIKRGKITYKEKGR